MSNQDFSNREIDYDRSISIQSRGQVIVPPHHTKNLKSVFGSTSVVGPRISDVISSSSVPVRSPEMRPVVVAVNDIAPPKVVGVSKNMPMGLSVQPVIEKHDISKEVETSNNKNISKFERQAKKSFEKARQAELKKAKLQAKTEKRNNFRLRGQPKELSGGTIDSGSNFANQVLASAASTMPTNVNNPNMTIDSAGAVAIPRKSGVIDNLSKLNSRITFEIKIDHKKILSFVRFVLIVGLLGVSGYLAWDIWFTNKPVNYSFAQSASAVSIDDTNPFNVDPTSISNQAWTAHTSPADQPRYLYLPSLGVKSRVLSAGINSNGNIDSPKNANDSAWYDGSAKPGQDGQTFINGHKSYSPAFSAVFDDLDQLKVGDIIVVENGNGDKFSYKVVKNESVDTSEVDMNKALNVPNQAKQGITLMTYSGKYNYREQTADKRVIVYAIRD